MLTALKCDHRLKPGEGLKPSFLERQQVISGVKRVLMKRKVVMRLSGVLALLALATVAGAQQHKSPPANAGVVSGSVFLITRGGDLKPARMAQVYLLYISGSVKATDANSDESSTVGSFWTDSLLIAMDEYDKKYMREGVTWTLSETCRQHLAMYRVALSQTLSWAMSRHKESPVILVNADENGTFKVAAPHSGKYIIIASGHAGFNDAFWEIGIPDRIVVNAGTTDVKLSSPALACVVE